jgi:hypothetical protein
MPSIRRRGSALLLAATTLLATAAPPAFAGGKPTVSPVPFPPEGILLPGGVFCDADILVEAIRNTEKATTFPADANGNVVQIVTGQLWIEVTNLDSNASVVLNISGPIKYLIEPDGTTTATLLGRSVPVQPPGLIVNSGRTIQVTHPDGSSEILSRRGHVIDVCALVGAS